MRFLSSSLSMLDLIYRLGHAQLTLRQQVVLGLTGTEGFNMQVRNP